METRLLKKDIKSKISMLQEYALYGNESAYLKRISKKEIKKLKESDLKDLLKKVFTYETYVHFVGNSAQEKVISLVKDLPFSNKLIRSQSPHIKTLPVVKENQVYFIKDTKAIQSHIRINVPSKALDEEGRIFIKPYNLYFGSGMNSLIFREAREFRSLAYSAWGYFKVPYKFDSPGMLNTGMSTQADKTNEAVNLLLSLIDSMPYQESQMNSLRSNLLMSFNTQIPSFRSRSYSVQYWKMQGYNRDPREVNYPHWNTLGMEDIQRFYSANIAGRKHILSVVGNPKQFDLDSIVKKGSIKKLKIKDVLRY